MQWYITNDNLYMGYLDLGLERAPPLILLHGFTGSSDVWQRNIPALSQSFRIIAPDLRGHGKSAKSAHGYHVTRLAMDLKNLIDHLELPYGRIMCIAGSLGCSILWAFSELFTTNAFSHMVWVDQSPLQNYTSDGSWGPEFGNRGCNSAAALANLQATLKYKPEDVYKGTIASCLAYRSHPRETDNISVSTLADDEKFFLDIAQKGDPIWYGKLMADHTSLDWRDSIWQTFGADHGSKTKVLVVASERSGCFPAAGPLSVLDLVNSDKGVNLMEGEPEPRAVGVTIDWGGHWCYWEDPARFNALVLGFLLKPSV